ncbi:hypothetical protein [Bacillus sp. TL12]|uniref:hypothetical protein n=1 Tax=Bacillus sp. TL12 TaxID=2894756 RepID=UPI001F52A101|nr:hypothetical protein [Bacillus sp. TL12]MCI0764325.1 hypothetical protein [Bacillus sp. TL12]
MQIRKKKGLSMTKIHHIMNSAHICKRYDGVDSPSDLYVDILKKRKKQLNIDLITTKKAESK